MKLFISLGSNLGSREDNLEKARSSLSGIIGCSSVIETKAILPPNAPPEWNIPYLNQVCLIELDKDIFEYLKYLKDLEHTLGRPLIYERWAPRIIDIDLLLAGKLKINTPHLSIPHKELVNRHFLLELIQEIDSQALSFISN